MTIGELWDWLAKYPDDMPVYIGFIDGHNVIQEDFSIAETTALDGTKAIALMTEDIGAINN